MPYTATALPGAATEERPMAASEAMFAALGAPLVTGHTLHGPVDTVALDTALADLTRIRPVLTGRCLPGDWPGCRPGCR
jgi:hypothetical protein